MISGNNGLLQKTVNAKEMKQQAKEKELINLSIQSALIDGLGSITKESLAKSLEEHNFELGEDDENIIQINSNLTTYYFYKTQDEKVYGITKDGKLIDNLSYANTMFGAEEYNENRFYFSMKGDNYWYWNNLNDFNINVKTFLEGGVHDYATNDSTLSPIADDLILTKKSDNTYEVSYQGTGIASVTLSKVELLHKFHYLSYIEYSLDNEEDFFDADWIDVPQNSFLNDYYSFEETEKSGVLSMTISTYGPGTTYSNNESENLNSDTLELYILSSKKVYGKDSFEPGFYYIDFQFYE